jgi:ribosomal protein S18 acetylase RimI-like enzyme
MSTVSPAPAARPLTRDDFDRVVAIDAQLAGRRRPGFYRKRLEAALAEPGHFIYAGVDLDGELAGFLMARLIEGEYGAAGRIAALDAIGVDPRARHRGLGQALMRELERILRHKQIDTVQTQADWRNHNMLRFFAAAEFRLAPRLVLEREVGYPTADDADAGLDGPDAWTEIDFSRPQGRESGVLERDAIFCRSLNADDVSALVRIDRRVGGRDRTAYYRRKAREVLEEAGIASSLVAECDGSVVGFMMARVDFGEFGRTEPEAVLDSMAVDPGYAHRGIGTALLAQLLGNLATLRLERVRTEVECRRVDLLAFLMRNGFGASGQLAFVRRVAA